MSGPYEVKDSKRFHQMDSLGQKPIRIQGIITASGWNEDGGVEAVSISTFDEDQYLVLRNDMGERIMRLLHEEVEVDGFVSESEGRKVIKIWKYRLI